MELKDYIPKLNRIMLAASDVIMEIYQQEFSVEKKDDNSPVTEADIAAHKIIDSGLAEISDFPVLSEESFNIPWSERKTWDTYWLVDPVDGTKEFIKKNGEFTVNIALIHKNEPVLGVVAVPAQRVLYSGVKGQGAWKQDYDGEPTRINVAHIPNAGWKVVGSRSHNDEKTKRIASTLKDSEFVSMGSSLKICAIAEGTADLYPRFIPTSEWDTGAAQAVLEAAGGQLLKLDLTPLRYNTKEDILNPYFVACAAISDQWSDVVKELSGA